MKYLDQKFIQLLSSSLKQFKNLQGGEKFNFRCWYCGDSEKSTTKARAYFLPDKKRDTYYYFCHNCGTNKSFSRALKDMDYALYKEYVKEQIAPDTYKISETITQKLPEYDTSKLESLPTINDLKEPHHAIEYVKSRKIPKEWYSYIRYTNNFKAFVNSIIPNKFKTIGMRDTRIVIPFFDYDGNLLGFTGRALYETSLRYNAIMINELKRKSFGLDKVDFNKKYYVCEGPIDAMFIPNCCASAGSDIVSLARTLPNRSNAIIIFDNQPRNPEIISEYHKAIDAGFKVFIWPDSLENSKDINDAILAGYTTSELTYIIDTNHYEGLKAKAMVNQWQKIKKKTHKIHS